jgi:predicted nucleic acid-binding protein
VIILDTNVLSELMRPRPLERVTKWLTHRAVANLFVTSISQAEILRGIALMPRGKRRDALASEAEATFEKEFAGRVLTFGSAAARAYAAITAARRALGRPISIFDAQIAAIARARGGAIATRNVSDFLDCGIEVMDPWSER